MRSAILLGAALALTGCEKPDNASGPGGVTVGEARALDEAARVIDARRPPGELSQPFDAQWPEQNGRKLNDNNGGGVDGASTPPGD